jgi:spore germination cell wall hydrolase CwlJ-like protein
MALLALATNGDAAVRRTAARLHPQSIRTADRRDPVATRYDRHEIRCLARALWFEARGESEAGQIAVAQVILARTRDHRWRRDVCATIRMAKQFSFVRDGRSPPIPDPDDAQRMTDLVRDVASGSRRSGIRGALYYHATYAHPSWRHALKPLGRIGHHMFYADARRDDV